LRYSEYETVVIRRLAVMGLSEESRLMNAEDYTLIYSGFTKIAQMLVIEDA
jgi:hypothetical protein